MQLFQRLKQRHLMHTYQVSYEEYSLLLAIREKGGLVKEILETVREARGQRPLIDSTLKDFTLQLLQRLVKRDFIEKSKNRYSITEKGDKLISLIGPAEPFLLEEHCSPASISRITVISKISILLLFTYGFLTGGSLALLGAVALLLFDSGATIYFSHVDESSIKGNPLSSGILALLALAGGFLLVRNMIAPRPLSRTELGLFLLAYYAASALLITRFQINQPNPRRELLRRIAWISGNIMAVLLLLRAASYPLPIPRSLVSAGVGFIGSAVFLLLYLLQKKAGRRHNSFSIFYLAGQSRRYSRISLLATAIGLISFFGVYHLDYLFAASVVIILMLQILTVFRIARTRDARRRILELWLEERSRTARRHFFHYWVRNLISEKPVTKSGMLGIHAKNYGKKKAGISKGISIYLDRDGFFTKETDHILSNLLYDGTIHIENDRFTRSIVRGTPRKIK